MLHKKYKIDIPDIISIVRYTIQDLQLYVNDNIPFNNNPLISDELKKLKISSLWDFVDFDFQFFLRDFGLLSGTPIFFQRGPKTFSGPSGPSGPTIYNSLLITRDRFNTDAPQDGNRNLFLFSVLASDLPCLPSVSTC